MTAARAVPLALLGGLVASMLALAANPNNVGAMMLAAMAPLPVFLVGFGVGGFAGLSAAVVGVTATAVVGGSYYAAAFVELVLVPVAVLVPLALAPPTPPPAGRLLIGQVLLGFAVFALIAIVLRHEPGSLDLLRSQIEAKLREATEQRALPPGMTQEALAAAITSRLPGLAIVLWLLLSAANAALAQGVLVRFGWNLRPTPSMAALRMSRLVSVAFVAAVIAARVGKDEVAFIGINLAEILAVPLVLVGLAVAHVAARRYSERILILTSAYAAVMIMVAFAVTSVSVWPIVAVVALGVVEQWVGLRQLLAASTSRGEK